jgi:hypothetical protein
MEVGIDMGLGHVHDRGFVSHLAGCTVQIVDRRFLVFFLEEVSQNSSPNSLVARSHGNQCYAPAWGSCNSCHCSEGALRLRLSLNFSFTALACESVGPPTC